MLVPLPTPTPSAPFTSCVTRTGDLLTASARIAMLSRGHYEGETRAER
jgi:hypothetical protein